MNTVKLVAIFTENKVGQLARITQTLAEAGVNIRWVTIATSEGFGVVKLLADRSDLAFSELKAHQFTVSQVEVLAVEVKDRPGGLHQVAECMAHHGMNVENSSGFIWNHRAVLLMEVDDPVQAGGLLEAQGLRLLSQEELLSR
jgi:hypothetical protein